MASTRRAVAGCAGFPRASSGALPYDTPIVGYRVNTVNVLRLWKAEAAESFDFAAFNVGDYYRAVEQKVASENLTKVLYPNDEALKGKRLRLEQQYFFVSCSLQDMIRLHLDSGASARRRSTRIRGAAQRHASLDRRRRADAPARRRAR